LRSAGNEPSPTLESNSMIVLFAHVRTGRWASIMPAKLAEALGLTDSVRAIPIVEPAATHAVGLVVPDREPTTPLIAALVAEARQLARTLDLPSPNEASGIGTNGGKAAGGKATGTAASKRRLPKDRRS
jgi:DNA-binding transcriptional LysR family regulator